MLQKACYLVDSLFYPEVPVCCSVQAGGAIDDSSRCMPVVAAARYNGAHGFPLGIVELGQGERAGGEWITDASEPDGEIVGPCITSRKGAGINDATVGVTLLG